MDGHRTEVCNSGNKKPILYPPQGRRLYLLLENRSPAEIYINFGRPANILDGIRLYPGGTYEREIAVPQGEIHLCGSTAGDQFINVTES